VAGCLAVGVTGARAADACPPAGHSRASLEALKSISWSVPNEVQRAALAEGLLGCLGHPDPALRDAIAYEGLSRFMRSGALPDATLHLISTRLTAMLSEPDEAGLRRPFAALVLSEVVRADRMKPFMTASQREGILMASLGFMLRITDYRGFDPREGYRHSVAHGADLLMQLAMNPGIDSRALPQIRAALSVQAETVATSYVTGEGERLARAILMIARRRVLSEADWTDWASRLAGPGVLKTWDNWHVSPEGLARRHNLVQFFSSLYINTAGKDPDFAALRPGVLAALKALP
jgi:Protein of unknown function (DUF2785)